MVSPTNEELATSLIEAFIVVLLGIIIACGLAVLGLVLSYLYDVGYWLAS